MNIKFMLNKKYSSEYDNVSILQACKPVSDDTQILVNMFVAEMVCGESTKTCKIFFLNVHVFLDPRQIKF